MSGIRSYVLIILASMLWGTMGVLAKLAFEYGIFPETLIALRLVLSFATLLFALLLFGRGSLKIRRSDLPRFLVFGVFAVAFQRISYFYAVDLTGPTLAAFLFYTYPVFVTLFAFVFWKEKVTAREVAAIVLTFTGVAFVVRAYDVSCLRLNFLGIAAGLLSSVFFVFYFFSAKRLRKDYASWTLTLYGDGVGALSLLPIILFSSPQVKAFPSQLWLLILVIAWVPSLLAYLLFSHALKHVRSQSASVLSVLEPLSAAVLSTVFLGENLEAAQILGMALALSGVTLLLSQTKKQT